MSENQSKEEKLKAAAKYINDRTHFVEKILGFNPNVQFAFKLSRGNMEVSLEMIVQALNNIAENLYDLNHAIGDNRK